MRLTNDQAGELLASLVHSTPRTACSTPTDVINAAVDNLRREYKELLAVLDEKDWAERVAAFCRLNIPAEHSRIVADDIYSAGAWLETALLKLLETHVLQLAVVTPEAQADLESLRKSVRFYNLLPQEESAEESAVAAAPQPVAVDPVDQCVIDFKVLCSADFKAKWMTRETRPIYDRAVELRRI